VAFVSGAARGLGARVAQQLARDGARVVVTDVREQEGKAVERSLGEVCPFVHLNVTDESQGKAAMRATLARFGGLNVLVNNAGIFRTGPLNDTSAAAYLDVVQVNQGAAFSVCDRVWN
jgi:NAD(P)-dependent dehydrogenase (short-subunit alcohol dehydrogenase family)